MTRPFHIWVYAKCGTGFRAYESAAISLSHLGDDQWLKKRNHIPVQRPYLGGYAMTNRTSRHETGQLTRFFDRPITAEIFMVVIWALFIMSFLDVKLPTDLSPSNASASVPSQAR